MQRLSENILRLPSTMTDMTNESPRQIVPVAYKTKTKSSLPLTPPCATLTFQSKETAIGHFMPFSSKV